MKDMWESFDRTVGKHADRHGLVGLRRAVFVARGGHAPGEACDLEQPLRVHLPACVMSGSDECICQAANVTSPEADPSARVAELEAENARLRAAIVAHRRALDTDRDEWECHHKLWAAAGLEPPGPEDEP